MKFACLFAFSLLLAPLASAAPILGVLDPDGNPSTAQPAISYEISFLGGNLFGYNVFVDDLDPTNLGAWFVDQLTFTGQIQQLKVGKNSVNDNETAEGFDGFGGYDMTLDSYFFTPFTDNLVSTEEQPGIVETLTSYAITAGSGGGSELNKAQIAYIVATGPIGVSGVLNRATGTEKAGSFLVEGTIAVPEPATVGLFVLGAAAIAPLLRVRRRA